MKEDQALRYEIELAKELDATSDTAELLNQEKANTLLLDPEFFEKAIRELDKTVVGEYPSRKVLLLCMNGKNVQNAKLTSFNLLVNDESGAGKDHVTSKVGELYEKEKVIIKRTRISERVLNYLHNPKFEPDWTWDGKILYLEDISNNILNSEVVKVFLSSGSHVSILVEQRPVEIEIKGKPVVITTTAAATPNPEQIRRFTILNLDTTVDQTKGIAKRDCQLAKSGVVEEIDPSVKLAISKLERKKVRIPYADLIGNWIESMPKEQVRVVLRTQLSRFLDWIKSSAVFYQLQRKEDDEGYLLANKEDYNLARECFLKVMSNPFLIPLTKDQQNVVASFDILGDSWHKIDDIVRANSKISESWLRKILNKLVEYGLLEREYSFDNDGYPSDDDYAPKKGYKSDRHILTFHKPQYSVLDIPDFDRLQKLDNSNNKINGIGG